MYTINLRNVNKRQIELVGGKGANLGELIGAGFSVPQGFCITSTAYDEYVRSNGFDVIIEKYLAKIDDKPEQAAQLSDELIQILRNGEVSPELFTAITQSYGCMGNNCHVAVRSSATAEDLPENSFAGQQETYLNICGLEELIAGIPKCFASLWSQRAIDYRKQTGFDKQKISLAVVVQEMVNGDVSGVLFSANPINNSRDEMVISASYGLGEAVVSGMVTPDTFIWDTKKNTVKDKVLGSKEITIVYDPILLTAKKETEIEQQKRYCLTTKEIELLTSMGKQIEQHYGYAQDIEWTIKGGQLYILQARGITTLVEKADDAQIDAEKKFMKMLLEFYVYLPYPLELAPINSLFNDAAEQLGKRGIKLDHDPIQVDSNGKFVFKIESYGEETVPGKSLPGKSQAQTGFDENISYYKKVFGEIQSDFENLERLDISTLSQSAIAYNLNKLAKIAETTINTRKIYCNFPYISAYFFISDAMKTAGLDHCTPDLLSDLHYKFWDMNVELGCLAEKVNEDAALKDRILLLSTAEDITAKLSEIAEDFPAFGKQYYNLMKVYGWNSTDSQRAFSAVSWNEDKQFFLTLLRVAMGQESKWTSRGKYDGICSQIKATLPLEQANDLLEKIKEMRKYRQNREESHYLLEWCYGLSRRLLHEVVARFPQLFSCYKDVLYLLMDEVLSLCESGTDTGLAERIAVRKEATAKNQDMWDSAACTIEDTKAAGDGKTIIGCSGSAGKVQGKVRVIHDASEFSKLKPGEILICRSTDPIWTPLFAIAKAVVTDVGGPLAHSAIIAREYGIPAVMGCGNATKVLWDGQEVIVDGNKGVVSILAS